MGFLNDIRACATNKDVCDFNFPHRSSLNAWFDELDLYNIAETDALKIRNCMFWSCWARAKDLKSVEKGLETAVKIYNMTLEEAYTIIREYIEYIYEIRMRQTEPPKTTEFDKCSRYYYDTIREKYNLSPHWPSTKADRNLDIWSFWVDTGDLNEAAAAFDLNRGTIIDVVNRMITVVYEYLLHHQLIDIGMKPGLE